MKKVFKFVKGRREDRKDGGITPSQSGDLVSPAQTPEDERFLGLDSASGYIVDFCGKDKSLTKLHKAAWQGNLDKVKNALKKVDIDSVDRHNRTSLHFAVVQGHPNIVWFLLGSNARMTICDSEGRTPLLKAIECGHKECMNLLLERGANVNHADFLGYTPLHIAVKQSLLDITTILIQKGADPGVANNNGEYPLHMAMRTQNKDMVQLLLRADADVNVVDRENRTPLMLAAKTGNLILSQLFFEYGAQLYMKDSNGWTAEDYAVLGGHQGVALELKTLMKKDAKPTLETHTEEDETEVLKSDVDTWNDSNCLEKSKAAASKQGFQVTQFLRKFSAESDEKEKSEREEEFVESPGSGVMPPPCQPPRSWEIIEAGMIDEAISDGTEPKRRSITALGSLHSRRESFTENSGNHSDGAKHTLSLNRRKDSKKNSKDVKQRFSFNEEESLKNSLSDEFSLLGSKEEVQLMMRIKRKEKREKENSGSDWDSNLSSLLESSSGKEKQTTLPCNSQKPDLEGTLGRNDTLNEVSEMWIANAQLPLPDPPVTGLPTKVDEEGEVSSSWDSGESFHEMSFPPPPTAFELGVDMAKSMSYIKGISIDHAPGSEAERDVWQEKNNQTQSLDRLDEKETADVEPSEKTVFGQRHTRNPSISNQKWKSVELPPQQRPVNRLVDVNRRINDQLECYDQALRELAESSYAKKQDAIISTLIEPNTSIVENYYSLPSSRFKVDREFSISGKTKANAKDYAMSLPLAFSKKPTTYCEPPFKSYRDSGPLSLPFTVNDVQSRGEELENNEKLGFEDNVSPKIKEKPKNEFSNEKVEVDNIESPLSDELAGNDKSDRKSKRHMLLAMRDVKHAVQVANTFKTSLDDQILSPLTKVDGKFDLSPKKLIAIQNGSEVSPSEESAFFRGDSQNTLDRQETVIERPNFRGKSTPSDSEDEPTLWLQEKAKETQPSSGPTSDEEAIKGRSHKDSYRRISASSVDSSPTNAMKGRRTPSAALRRLQRLESSSENEESVREGKDKMVLKLDDDSPDVSLSSGPIELLGKDSGSDLDISHREGSPVHHYSLKKHHKWLKERLQAENKERQQLEEVAAQLAEKAERLQYELADAKEATKSRDEIITLLQGQLSRMEEAYTKSLEESVHCRLQLTTLEQEILHLKELCSQYEEERELKAIEAGDKQGAILIAKIRQLEEEREGLSRVVVRLEQENRTLEKLIKDSGKDDDLDDSRWTERCKASNKTINSQLRNAVLPDSNSQESLTASNIGRGVEYMPKNDDNVQKLENTLDFQISTLDNDHINHYISILTQKNFDLQKKIETLQKKLEEALECKEKYLKECSENSVVKSKGADLVSQDNEDIEILKMENLVLKETIEQLKVEISRLKIMPNSVNSRLTEEILNNAEVNSKNGGSEVEELRNLVQELQVTLEATRKDGKVLGDQLNVDVRSNVGVSRTAKDDELAWSNLYGIKNVQRKKGSGKLNPQLHKDSEELIEQKVRELEQELIKTKEEILRQRLESNFRLQSIMPSFLQNEEILDLKKKIVELENNAMSTDALRYSLETKTAEVTEGHQERKKLEFELETLRGRLKREFVPKVDVEAAKLQADLLVQRLVEETESRSLEDGLRERLVVLAKEREKAAALRRRLGRQCVSWDTGVGLASRHGVSQTFRSLPRERPAGAASPTPILDPETKEKLAQQLDNSIRHYDFDLTERKLELPQDSSTLKLDFLKKENLS